MNILRKTEQSVPDVGNPVSEGVGILNGPDGVAPHRAVQRVGY